MPLLCLSHEPKKKLVGHEKSVKKQLFVTQPQIDADFLFPVLPITLQWPPDFVSVPLSGMGRLLHLPPRGNFLCCSRDSSSSNKNIQSTTAVRNTRA